MEAKIIIYVQVEDISEANDVVSDINEILNDCEFQNSTELEDIYEVD